MDFSLVPNLSEKCNYNLLFLNVKKKIITIQDHLVQSAGAIMQAIRKAKPSENTF